MPLTLVHRKAALAIILTVQLMLAMDFLIVVVSLKNIQADLGFTAADLSWIPNAFGLAFGGLLLLGGRLGDLIGQVKAFRIGLAIFVLASLSGGMASSPALLASLPKHGKTLKRIINNVKDWVFNTGRKL